MTESQKQLVAPWDEHNQTLVSHVHPTDWANPEPAEKYNLVVIGAGTAGLVTAAGAAGLGAKVALIEQHLMGGDCLNVGCVPSKTIIRSSRAVADQNNASPLGVHPTSPPQVDFVSVMARMRKLRAQISPNDSAQRFKNLGVDVFLGAGRFKNDKEIEVDGKILKFKKAVIASGARALEPLVPGLSEAGFLTNETVFSLTEQPKRLAVIGGGPIGCELAQSFHRLGSEVTVLHKNAHLLDREDQEAADIIQKAFIKEKINLALNVTITRVEKNASGKTIHYTIDGKSQSVVVDEILIGAGRAPNVENLNLDAVHVRYDKRTGVKVNDHLKTTNPNIYAAGDVCMNWKFTHAADAAARIVIQNTLFCGRKKLSSLVMPWCTYTDPEIAHVGLYERDAHKAGFDTQTFVTHLKDVDRAITDGETDGFVKIHVKKGSDKILGATVVSKHAGDMISELTLAITAGVGLGKISGVIHPYPTQAEAIKRTADAFNRTRLTPKVKKVFSSFLKWTR